MTINDDLITYLEDLSNLSLTDEEKKQFTADLQIAFDDFKNLTEHDIKGIDEVDSNKNQSEHYNIFRSDIPTKPLDRELFLKNAPFHNEEMIIAPRTVGE